MSKTPTGLCLCPSDLLATFAKRIWLISKIGKAHAAVFEHLDLEAIGRADIGFGRRRGYELSHRRDRPGPDCAFGTPLGSGEYDSGRSR